MLADAAGTEQLHRIPAYKTHKCDAIPQYGKAFMVMCELEPTADGRVVCYYQQPGRFAPLSLTCAAGGCVYDGGALIAPRAAAAAPPPRALAAPRSLHNVASPAPAAGGQA
ncbi:hypothetical protein JKP88DRAFT_275951 [Tribonema minus]|uniref:Uncharacterized protein n=1 Tax=Tribonema minus TaxID=303371 RepID=A0A835Z7P4_9STRA|nr:hypothetical protein JKP88DRAFT_275951 [Tribonema minus]